MRKIGIYLERYPESGGAYQYCLAVLNALGKLPREKYQILAFCTYSDWEKIVGPLGIQTEVVKKNLFEKIVHYTAEKLLPVELYRKYCRQLHPLARRFRRCGIELCIYPCGDKISFMMDTPAVVTVFDLMHRYLKDFPEIAAPKIYRSRERSYTNIVRFAKVILVDSEVGKQQMIDCYDRDGRLAEKISILPYIAPDYIYTNAGREKYPCPVKFDKYIFYPAQFWKHKNHKNLIKALANLKKKGMQVNAVFCGSGKNAYEEIRGLIKKYRLEEQIIILGYVSNEEMVALYQHARALIMPTFGGPTNIPQLEAFVLGCPVATSRIYGIPEQVGEAALLFAPENVREITDCVELLWKNDEMCNLLREKGYAHHKMWGEKQFQERLQQILEQI